MLWEQITPSKLIFWDRIKVDTDSKTLQDSNMCPRVHTRSVRNSCAIMSERRRLFYWYILQKTGPSHYYCAQCAAHDQFAIRPNGTTIPYIRRLNSSQKWRYISKMDGNLWKTQRNLLKNSIAIEGGFHHVFAPGKTSKKSLNFSHLPYIWSTFVRN